MRHLTHIPLGQTDYATALRLQERLVDAAIKEAHRAYLVTVEHCPAVITLGRRGDGSHILVPAQRLADEGIEVHTCSRGGQVTYHGPGQLVAYPIWQLARGGRSVHGHVHLLEEAIIRLLSQFGIDAARRQGAVGVYVGSAKVASVGAAVRQWVCYHGLALNVQPDLSHFDMIVPCGRPGEAATSMTELIGQPLNVTDVLEQFVACLCNVCGFEECQTVEAELSRPALLVSHA